MGKMTFKFVKNDRHLWDINLDYADKNNDTSLFNSEGNIHPYPAKAVPEMVHDLLYKFKETYDIKNVLDPFVGSGTVALESKLLGLDFYGSDLNPLAVLLAQTKSLSIKGTPFIKRKLEEFIASISMNGMEQSFFTLVSFYNIEYWFKEENIKQLSYIKNCIKLFLKGLSTGYRKAISLIVLTAFSATVRESSLTRNDEFKLYRLSAADMEKFNVNSIETFKKRITELINMIQDVNSALIGDAKSEVYLHNAKDLSYMGNTKVDLILTSPPYGDSQSTVAYGQFSRLSLQWMADLMQEFVDIKTEYNNCDEYLIGGKYSCNTITEDQINLVLSKSTTLRKLMNEIENLIKNEVMEFEGAIRRLSLFKQANKDNKDIIDFNSIFNDDLLGVLAKERIRLYIYRKIKSNTKLSKKQLKMLISAETDNFVKDLLNYNSHKYTRRKKIFIKILPSIFEALNRKIKSLPRRSKEVLYFFVDLYQVVMQSDKVLADKGLQAWILGHRTVLANIEVKLANILLEWFESMSYKKIALIKRNCHFKRLPKHINSTLSRNKEIRTMMEEYILIVQKK